MEELRKHLLDKAYLYDDPNAYRAGVIAALDAMEAKLVATWEMALDVTREEAAAAAAS